MALLTLACIPPQMLLYRGGQNSLSQHWIGFWGATVKQVLKTFILLLKKKIDMTGALVNIVSPGIPTHTHLYISGRKVD